MKFDVCSDIPLGSGFYFSRTILAFQCSKRLNFSDSELNFFLLFTFSLTADYQEYDSLLGYFNNFL